MESGSVRSCAFVVISWIVIASLASCFSVDDTKDGEFKVDKRIFCNPSGCSSTRGGKRTRHPRDQERDRYHMFSKRTGVANDVINDDDYADHAVLSDADVTSFFKFVNGGETSHFGGDNGKTDYDVLAVKKWPGVHRLFAFLRGAAPVYDLSSEHSRTHQVSPEQSLAVRPWFHRETQKRLQKARPAAYPRTTFVDDDNYEDYQ